MKTRYVLGLMFSPDAEKLVLIRKNRPAFLNGYLNPVGGHQEDGETPLEAVTREFLEETGVATTPEQWHQFRVIERPDTLLTCFYCLSPDYAQVRTTTEEPISVHCVADLRAMPDVYPQACELVDAALARLTSPMLHYAHVRP